MELGSQKKLNKGKTLFTNSVLLYNNKLCSDTCFLILTISSLVGLGFLNLISSKVLPYLTNSMYLCNVLFGA